MITNLFSLGCIVLPIMFALCIMGLIADLLMDYQERKEINIKVGDCLRW